ncbi:hypothetical protein IQ251_04595 [Saccharopolyspora sp. HNM0983]|uniref:Uncharacterized protein n=1 Tax=Saccharopolyspora montiporae TaxID=2781240 RepID=A0A929B7L9_9PSEU|nr:hypothetical protein [Saccharopolyspora sp. HNM0983]MBE9373726.1 hypothetical protein [Saccharopolyspora sp. HNM0983]
MIATSTYRACPVVHTGDLAADLPGAIVPPAPIVDAPTGNRWAPCLDAVDPDAERAVAKRIARSDPREPTPGQLQLVLQALQRL